MKTQNIEEVFVENYNWKAFYVVTKNWQSDLAFYSDEMKFFKGLVNKYFMWLIKDESLLIAEELIAKLMKIEREKNEIITKIELHLQHIKSLLEKNISKEDQYAAEHGDLEIDMTVFTKRFRDLKKEVFRVTEEIMESERLTHLLEK